MAPTRDNEVPSILTRALRGELSSRELAMIGYSEDTKHAILAAIELDPALEEMILLIAERAFGDGLTEGEASHA